VQWELPGAAARRDQGHPPVPSSNPPRRRAFCPDGDLGSSNRPFSMKAARADVSERGGPGLPGAEDREATGESSRANRLGVRSLPRPNPILPSRAATARARSKTSLKGGHEDQRRAPEWPDVRAPSGRAKAKRWTERTKTSGNSHCTLTLRGALPPKFLDT
jgi:hypothetical protein